MLSYTQLFDKGITDDDIQSGDVLKVLRDPHRDHDEQSRPFETFLAHVVNALDSFLKLDHTTPGAAAVIIAEHLAALQPFEIDWMYSPELLAFDREKNKLEDVVEEISEPEIEIIPPKEEIDARGETGRMEVKISRVEPEVSGAADYVEPLLEPGTDDFLNWLEHGDLSEDPVTEPIPKTEPLHGIRKK